MAPHASPVMTMSVETGPEQLPVSPGRAPAGASEATQLNRLRPLEVVVVQCSLCGIALPLGLLVPDGGLACAGIRWYCKDTLSCTGRWTTARPPGPAHMPAAPGHALAGAGEAAADGASAERPGGVSGKAKSAGAAR